MSTPLRELAHCRAGDKGTLLTLTVVPNVPEAYERLSEELTAARVASHLHGLVTQRIVRYELPHLPALQFVCERHGNETVTTALGLDSHGKTLSSALLELPIQGTDYGLRRP